MRAMGMTPPLPPSFEASRIEALRDLWKGAGFEDVETREIVVRRTFEDFDDYWATDMLANIGKAVAGIPPADAERLKARVRARSVGCDGAHHPHGTCQRDKGPCPEVVVGIASGPWSHATEITVAAGEDGLVVARELSAANQQLAVDHDVAH
jgi:hypothetical protein